MMMLLSFSSCFSQYWERLLGGPETLEYLYDLDETYDKGYIYGYTLVDEIAPNFQNYVQSSMILKTNINGDTLWWRNFRHDPLLLFSCRDVGDGTIVAQFASWDHINESSRILLVRIDECGNKMWCRFITDYSGNGSGYGSCDLEIINNRIILCRESYDNSLDSQFSILMYSLDGEKICEKPFLYKNDHPFMNSPFLQYLQPLPNNEFMLTGQTYYKANPSSPAWLRAFFVKFDAEGNEQWALPYGLKDTIVSCKSNCENVILQDSNRYFAFNSTYSNTDPIKLLLMKFNSIGIENGHVISEIDTVFNEGFSPYFAGAQKISDSKYVNILKYNLSDDPIHFGNAIVVVDSLISFFYDTLHLSGYSMTILEMEETFDGKYISGGYDAPYGEIQTYVNKFSIDPLSFDTMYTAPFRYDSLCTENIIYADTIYFDDCLDVGDYEFNIDISTDYRLHLFPNPTREEFTICLDNIQHLSPVNISILTLTGEVQWQGSIKGGEQSKRISVFSWPKGVYIITARMGNDIIGIEKVIVM
jgi:hypothetical protein